MPFPFLNLARVAAAVVFTLILTQRLPSYAQSNEVEGREPQESPKPNFTLGGYVEALYQWNFNQPRNGITNYRGFDNRHNSFTLSNVALDLAWDDGDLIGRATLQVGHTASSYYLAEPTSAGTNTANASSAELWKYIQQAYVGYRFAPAITVYAGVFLSPIGPETMPVRDNWNWSRSNLFFGLPFYHTGARLAYALSPNWAATVAAYNGWNSVVDNNGEKSISAQLGYTRPKLLLSLLYFGGVERPREAPEGRGWRHLFDSHVTWHVTAALSLLAHANAGYENTRFGASSWTAGAVYARSRLWGPLFLAVRGDAFHQNVAANAIGREQPIFWPAPWVSSGTATIDYRPHDRASFRLEYRHDQAGGDVYFGSDAVNGMPFAPNRESQDTLTIGATTWL